MPDASAPRNRPGVRLGNRLRSRRLAYRLGLRQPPPRKAPTPVAGPKVRFKRLVPSPVFVLCSERSGSTLLRALLDSHSQIHAPHELHLRMIHVDAPGIVERGMADLGLTTRDLENILWDRMLHIRLLQSGKSIIVDKTPHNVLWWRRIHRVWPRARFLFLYRHPQRVFESWSRARPKDDPARLIKRISRNMTSLADAAKHLRGLEVRYERLTHDPEAVTQEICAYLRVPWEPEMLDYGRRDNGDSFQRGLGDWSENIRSGEIRPDKPLPTRDEIAPGLLEVTKLTGYPV